jgi:(5-formylfuran-3-yl)methyl phosphate synthase
MTLFVACVKDKWEAEIAIAHGADLLDIGDPAQQEPVGLDAQAARAMAEAIAGRRQSCAFASNALAEPRRLREAVEGLIDAGLDYVKIALAGEPRRLERIAALAALGSRTKLIGVVFAEEAVDLGLVDRLAEAGFCGVALDTAVKPGKRLLDLCSLAALAGFVETARRKGLLVFLSGALEPPDVPRLLPLRPDALGFRGALCAGGERAGRLEAKAVSQLRDLIAADTSRRPAQGSETERVDYRLVAGRPAAPEPRERALPQDRIFVRDLVLPVRIGAYRSEQQAPQRVRFNVEAEVGRAPRAPTGMRDILSYDIITDGISRIIAEAHIDLVETLAERIAELVLAEPRVTRTIVRVEKLDTGPGSVGIEITRERPEAAASLGQSLPAVGNEK